MRNVSSRFFWLRINRLKKDFFRHFNFIRRRWRTVPLILFSFLINAVICHGLSSQCIWISRLSSTCFHLTKSSRARLEIREHIACPRDAVDADDQTAVNALCYKRYNARHKAIPFVVSVRPFVRLHTLRSNAIYSHMLK